MKQLTQKLKSGAMQVQDVPEPLLGKGMVLVRNHYSLISAGTEGGTVSAARKSLIGKAKERPQQAKQALDLLRQQGPVQAYRAVMKKLDAYSPLGYSCAGEVIAVGEGVVGFAVGDLVACAGNTASHAEVVAVPVNLCVNITWLKAEGETGRRGDKETGRQGDGESRRISSISKSPSHPVTQSIDRSITGSPAHPVIQSSNQLFLMRAAYNTLGAIALQGIRQADLRLGENCAVIGLGLIGQLTCLLLRASGIRAIGIDIDPRAVETARQHAVSAAFSRNEAGIEDKINELTFGLGCDAVIITAATSSLDPVNFAGAIARKKGKVVIVGNVPTGFDREPFYYRKELELRMSSSYGPGRYDAQYEEKGNDYPPNYVRWTEKRNMEAFQELAHSGTIDLDYLTSHVFKLDDAPKAYDLILEKKEPYLGILIEYETGGRGDEEKDRRGDKETGRQGERTERMSSLTESPSHPVASSSVSLAFIGAGSYAQSYLLPNLPKGKDVRKVAILAQTGAESRSAVERFGFETCARDDKDIFANPEINTVFIATRHDSHAEYVIKALKSGKHVFVEKPLCLNEQELEEITDILTGRRGDGGTGRISSLTESPSHLVTQSSSPILMLGFNRRFAPLTQILKDKVGEGPMAMIYRINAGRIPADSWIQDSELGGGRVIGEVCHFVDLLAFINGSPPVNIFAQALPDAHKLNDTLNISIAFTNGSIGTISYFANGSKSLFKEYIEVHRAGNSAVLSDFKKLEVFGKGKSFKKKLFSQDKGQKETVHRFLDAISKGKESPIGFEEIHSATLVTFKILESLRTGEKILLR